jgi:hypothetical protein
MTEAVKKSYEKAYVKEKYPGSSSTPGSMINALTSANPSQTLKVKIPNSELGVKIHLDDQYCSLFTIDI